MHVYTYIYICINIYIYTYIYPSQFDGLRNLENDASSVSTDDSRKTGFAFFGARLIATLCRCNRQGARGSIEVERLVEI